MYYTAKLLKDSKERFATQLVETLVRHQDNITEISTAIEISAGFVGSAAKVVRVAVGMLRQDPKTKTAVTTLMSHVVGDLGNRLNELTDMVSGMVDRSPEFGAAVLGVYDQIHEVDLAAERQASETPRCQCGALVPRRRNGGFFRHCWKCMDQMATIGLNQGSCFECGEPTGSNTAFCSKCQTK